MFIVIFGDGRSSKGSKSVEIIYYLLSGLLLGSTFFPLYLKVLSKIVVSLHWTILTIGQI